MIRLTIWLPPIVWMAVIMRFSSGDFSADDTSRILRPILEWLLPWASPAQIDAAHWMTRKTAHVTEYAVLTVLWFTALRHRGRSPRTAAWTAFLIAIAWAFVDELHQATQPSRTSSVLDVGLDALGATLVLVFVRAGWRRATAGLTTALLWTAAAGGALVIAINAASGVDSGVLWFTVPVAALLLVRRWRKTGERAPPTVEP